MGKSFVLRDGAGKAIGYMQQAGDTLRCGFRADEKLVYMDLYVVDADQVITENSLNPNKCEHEWYVGGKAIAGGCLVTDRRILADTGTEAKAIIRRYLMRRNEPQYHREDSENESKAETALREAIKHPERRWPPNPCCVNSTYKEGSWGGSDG